MGLSFEQGRQTENKRGPDQTAGANSALCGQQVLEATTGNQLGELQSLP